MMCPCRVCDHHRPACHGKCEAYKEWHELFIKNKQALANDRKPLDFLIEGKIKIMRKNGRK